MGSNGASVAPLVPTDNPRRRRTRQSACTPRRESWSTLLSQPLWLAWLPWRLTPSNPMGIPCFNRCSVKHLLRFVASLAPAWTGPALVRRQLVGLAAVLVGLLRLIHPPADGGQLDARLLAGERTALAALQSGEALGQVV